MMWSAAFGEQAKVFLRLALRKVPLYLCWQEVLCFLGLMNYFAIFIPNSTENARPLYEMLQGTGFNVKEKRRNQKLVIPNWVEKWGDQQRNSWAKLKAELSNPEVLATPDRDRKKNYPD